MNKRIFIAINLPEETKKKIFELFSSKIDGEKCKIVEEANLHITLNFLGYLSEEAIKELKEKMNALKEEKAFEVELTGIGEFGGRVLWLGVKNAEKIKEIQGKICELIGVRDKRFHAHITIARNKKMKAKELREKVEELKKIGFSEKIKIESIDLMESILQQKGPKYIVREKFFLHVF